MDDYAHHPTEIKATLETARACWPTKRLVVCFQPHRLLAHPRLVRRTGQILSTARTFLLVMDIYAASEKKDPQVSGEALAEAIRAHGHREDGLCGQRRGGLWSTWRRCSGRMTCFSPWEPGSVGRMSRSLVPGGNDESER